MMNQNKNLQHIFDTWVEQSPDDYQVKQWLLSKWEVFDGITWSQEKLDILFNSITSYLHLRKEHTLLDLGCGGGWILKQLAVEAGACYGLDMSGRMLQIARGIFPEGRFTGGEISRLPLKNNVCDAVLCYFVFINIQDTDYLMRAVKEMLRVVRPGGRILIGQLPDKDKSHEYDAAKDDYVRHYEKQLPSLGKDNSVVVPPPLRLFDRKIWEAFFLNEGVPYKFLPSFNPFYYEGQPPLVNWRFDIVLQKPDT